MITPQITLPQRVYGVCRTRVRQEFQHSSNTALVWRMRKIATLRAVRKQRRQRIWLRLLVLTLARPTRASR